MTDHTSQIKALTDKDLSWQISMKVAGYPTDAVGLEPTTCLETVVAALRDGVGNYVMAYQRMLRTSMQHSIPAEELTYEVRIVQTDSKENDEFLRLLSLEFVERLIRRTKK